ncbi:MAG: hypothetical protein R3C29_12000 [Dehalococcoidia bacterium]
MPLLPRGEVAGEGDAELAAHHVHELSWIAERAAAVCAMNLDDETLAEALAVTVYTVRGQRFRAAHKILELTSAPTDRVHLGRWCMFHWDCCLVRVAKRIEDGTWLVA